MSKGAVCPLFCLSPGLKSKLAVHLGVLSRPDELTGLIRARSAE